MSDRWEEIWAGRSADVAPGDDDVLPALMAADGLDTAFGAVDASAWAEFAHATATDRLGLAPGDSVFEVGCGAGAFLYPLHRLGIRVAGTDRSAALIESARRVMPDAGFDVGDADAIPATPRFDAVVSCGVFLYFPDLDYADSVIRAMAGKATRAVAILDVPDVHRREAALAERMAAIGGEEAYAERYRGLDHLYYSRDWLAERLSAAGLGGVETADQAIPGYDNGRFRFNAWGFRGTP